MTGIASSLSGMAHSFSRVQSAIGRDFASGAISATDKTAITAALGDIKNQLASGTSAAGTAASGATASSPTSLKGSVEAMIDGEVSNGTLTASQATELKGAFQQVHAHMHGSHGHGGISSIVSALTGGDAATDGSQVTASSSTSTTDVLGSFVSQVRSAVSANSVYGTAGSKASSAASIFINALG